MPLEPVRVAGRLSSPERAIVEATAVVSWPVSEPAPVPKPRLEFADVMPLAGKEED